MSTDGISEKDIYTDCKQVAREYRLSGGWIEGQIMGDLLESLTMLLTMQDAADILCDNIVCSHLSDSWVLRIL